MMDYAVLLYFDPLAEARIKATIDRLADRRAVNSTYRDTGLRPNVTLAEFNAPDIEAVNAIVQRFAATWPPFPIRLGSIGVFPAEPAVLFYAPIVNDILFAFHRGINTKLKRICSDFAALYQDRNWVAHCTLALNLTTAEVQSGIALLASDFEAIDARLAGIDVITCCPLSCIASYPLPRSPESPARPKRRIW